MLGENIKGGFVLGENIKGGFSYQSALARTFRARFPLSQFGREHSGRVFLLVGPGEIIQVEFSFLSDRSRTFRASVPRSETFRASLKRAKLPSTEKKVCVKNDDFRKISKICDLFIAWNEKRMKFPFEWYIR